MCIYIYIYIYLYIYIHTQYGAIIYTIYYIKYVIYNMLCQ